MANAFIIRPLPMTLTASSTAGGHDPSYAGNDLVGVTWQPNNSAAPKLTIDLGSDPNPVDAILIFAISGTATQLQVRAASNSGFTSSVYDSGIIPLLAGSEMPTHGLGVGWWTKDDGALTRRYWELTFSASSGNVQPGIGRVAMGQRIILERNFGFGGGFGVRDLGKVDFGPHATLLRRRAAKMPAVGITFSNVRKDEVEKKIQPLAEGHGAQEPIAICTNPAADSMRQRRCHFGPLIGDLGTIQRNAVGWEWKANLVDLVPVPAGPAYVQPF
jgi:hypothetical protein